MRKDGSNGEKRAGKRTGGGGGGGGVGRSYIYIGGERLLSSYHSYNIQSTVST